MRCNTTTSSPAEIGFHLDHFGAFRHCLQLTDKHLVAVREHANLNTMTTRAEIGISRTRRRGKSSPTPECQIQPLLCSFRDNYLASPAARNATFGIIFTVFSPRKTNHFMWRTTFSDMPGFYGHLLLHNQNKQKKSTS